MNFSADPRKEFDKLQHHFMIKPLGILGMGKNLLSDKRPLWKPIPNTPVDDEIRSTFPLRSETR